jgi:PAS domain S-box-containing protein
MSTPIPKPRRIGPGFLGPDSDISDAIAAFDWGATELGPIDRWPGELRTGVNLMLAADYPAAIWWGEALRLIHNQAYEDALLRDRGRAIGRSFEDIWGDVAAVIRPQFDEVLRSGQGMSRLDEQVFMLRNGVTTETWWNYSFTPILDRDGRALGIFNGARETTDAVVERRTNALLVDLDTTHLQARDIGTIVAATLRTLGEALAVQRVGFAEIAEDRVAVIQHPSWTDGSIAAPDQSWPGSFDGHVRGMGSGTVLEVADVHADPRFAAPAARGYFDRLGVRASVVCPVHDGVQAVGGLFVQSRDPRTWSRIDLAIVQGAADRLWQAINRQRAEIARQASEARYRLIFEQADDIIFTADIDQRITDANEAGARAMGLSRDQIVGRSIADFVSSEDFGQTTAMLRQKIEHGGHTRHEVTVTGRDGRRMRWENNSTLITDRDGKPVGVLSISRDVTERRAFDERRELLIKELNHRVKNTLALVQAIAMQTFPKGQHASTEFLARLHTLAAAHDLLTRDHWEGVTLAELARASMAAHDTEASRIATGGPDVRLTPKAAVALAMALHELATNAVKYGALSAEAGRVDLIWSLHDGRLTLDWRESGGPEVAPPTRRGFGVRMVERVLASDLGGRVTLDFAPGGLHVAVDAPEKGNLA